MRILSLLLVLTFGSIARADVKQVLRAGAYAIDVTPEKFPVIVNGSFTEKTANSAIDRLHARCLILDDGTTRIGMVVVDSCMMPREFLDKTKQLAAKDAGLKVENILISATHTHSAPAVMGCLGSDADPIYPAFLQAQIARGLAKAAAELQPAKFGHTSVDATGYTHNRRWILRPDKIRNDPFGEPTVKANMHPGYQHPDFIGPSGPVDPELSIISVRSLKDEPIAVFCNFSMHYFGAPAVSSDYYGPFCDNLKKLIAGNESSHLVTIMSQGTSGDLMWMDYSKAKSDMTLAKYADGLSKLAFEGYKKIEYRENVPLKMAQRAITIDRRVSPDKLEWAQPILKKLGDQKPKAQPEIYAREAKFLRDEPKREILLQSIKIGDLGIAAIPNEVFAVTGLKLKSYSPLERTFVIELANGSEGYIPPAEQHSLGGYTTWPARTAALEEHAENLIVEKLLRMLEEVSGDLPRKFKQHESPYYQAVRSAKPLSYWSMGEMGGVWLDDRMEKETAALRHPTAMYLDGPDLGEGEGKGKNRCVHFAGGRMTADGKDLGANYSVAFWFWNGLPADARPVTGYLFSRGPQVPKDSPADHLGIGGTEGNAGRLFFFNGDPKSKPIAGTNGLKEKHWHHVVFVREGKNVRAYLDGSDKPEFTGESPNEGPQKNAVYFAGRCDNLVDTFFAGKMDEVAIFNRALTGDEVKKLLGQINR